MGLTRGILRRSPAPSRRAPRHLLGPTAASNEFTRNPPILASKDSFFSISSVVTMDGGMNIQ